MQLPEGSMSAFKSKYVWDSSMEHNEQYIHDYQYEGDNTKESDVSLQTEVWDVKVNNVNIYDSPILACLSDNTTIYLLDYRVTSVYNITHSQS